MAEHSPALRGRTVVTTRERRGRLDTELARAGADVMHVPLLHTADPSDDGAALSAELSRLEFYDWVVVTSVNGAERVSSALAALSPASSPRVAAVGTRTAEVITRAVGRSPDIVPARQTAADLVATMGPGGDATVLLAQADRADGSTASGLGAHGFDVTAVIAYRTVLRAPSHAERRAALAADCLVLASGSAAEAWSEAIGEVTPPVVVSIGPSTDAAAAACGVKITHTAADHSIDGLAAEIIRALTPAS